MEDHQGRQLGNYKLLHLVGRGGFADVYLGEHIHLRTQAAIKVLQIRPGDANREGFLNEARIIAQLIHPYIVRVLDFGIQNNISFLVIDYAPHGTFRKRFLQGTPRPEAPLVPYVKQVAAALQYGHDKNVIHRDVKPENILLGSNHEVLLSDFGLALISYHSVSRSLTEIPGTAAYMAPEQLQGKPRPASDQYSLGIIAYEWLTGRCPFQGSFFEVASQHVLAQPASLQEKAPGTSREVEKVVLRALGKDPQKRFPNVREFSLALEEACLSVDHHSLKLPLELPLELPLKQNITTNTSPLSNMSTTVSATNQHFISSGSAHKRVTHTLITEDSLGAQEQILYPDTAQEMASRKNAGTSSPGPVPPPFLSLATPPSLAESIQTSDDAGKTPFTGFPPLSPAQLPDSIERAWIGSLPAQTNISAPSGNTYLSGGQRFQRTTLNHLKAVAAPIYKDNHFRPTNTIIILLVLFLIIASGIGIFALSNNQKSVLQQNIVATSGATKASTARANQALEALQASQTAVAGSNPYQPTNGGTLVFNDPLTSDTNSWQVGPDATAITAGKCLITDQGYQVDAPSVAHTPCFQTTQTFSNFTYQVDLTFSAIGQNYSGGGIIFRSSSDFKRYYYFEIYENGSYTLQKCTELNCINYMDGYRLGKPAVPSFQTGINVTNTLAVLVNGNTIDLFVNKQKISEVSDQISTPYTSGLIGMMATAGNNLGIDTATNTATIAIFSHAKVWKF